MVLEVRLPETITIEDGRLFVKVTSGIPVVVLWRHYQSLGACGRQGKVLVLYFSVVVFIAEFDRVYYRYLSNGVGSHRYLVIWSFFAGKPYFGLWPHLSLPPVTVVLWGSICLKDRNLRSGLVSSY